VPDTRKAFAKMRWKKSLANPTYTWLPIDKRCRVSTYMYRGAWEYTLVMAEDIFNSEGQYPQEDARLAAFDHIMSTPAPALSTPTRHKVRAPDPPQPSRSGRTAAQRKKPGRAYHRTA
jgi:hypothetical protein